MAAQPAAAAPEAKVTPLTTEALPDYPGKEATMIMVEYPPGAVDPVQRHDAHAFVYVVEDSIVMGVRGGKEVTLKAGDTLQRKAQRCSRRWTQYQQNRASKIRRVPAKEKGRTDPDGGEVATYPARTGIAGAAG